MVKNKVAFNAIESMFHVAWTACFPDRDADEEMFFHKPSENVQTELMRAQKNICADFGVTPQNISIFGDEKTFTYSVEPFL